MLKVKKIPLSSLKIWTLVAKCWEREINTNLIFSCLIFDCILMVLINVLYFVCFCQK
jgi:hypothetical protein